MPSKPVKPARPTQKSHKHCDHYVTGCTNGLAESGEDTFICCHCARQVVKKWKAGLANGHGPHSGMTEKHYVESRGN